MPSSVMAATVAQVPVPQAQVSPLPRSHTRIFRWVASTTCTNSVLMRSGKLAAGGASVVYCDDFAELYDHFRAIPDVGKFTDWTDEDLTAFANNIKDNGAKAGYQLATMGLVFSGFEPDPTAIFQSSDCMDMTAEEISNLIADTIKAAATLKRCGFDCVEINAAGENIGQTFMSRNRNKREDDYGPQTFESRTRFVCEIVRGIKAECGEDFPVQVLINGVEENDKAIGDNAFFTTVEENKEMCKLIEAAGADSLHIRHLVGVMILKHFQMCGHRPLALIGGATGMIGDPSGKSQERNLLDEPTLRHNQEAIKRQLAKLLDFESDAPNAAVLVNNYDWMKDISFLEFIRDIGKCITVNYMMAKDSVKKRFSGEGDGMSFTEFTYQLVQGFDFLHLYQTMNCKVQLGGADQWGNITTGTELIRRKLGNEAEAFAITCPLITKADGTKFGKTESGNVWLDARYTSPYKFYQFWLNVSDEDAKRYIRIFTLLDRETVEALTAEHEAAPHLRVLQKRLAQEITTMIHSREEYEKAVEASAILFGGSTSEALRKIDEETLLQVFEGVPQFRIARAELGLPFVDLCAEKTQVFPSKGECRKMVQGGGVSLNKEKVADPARTVGEADLIAGKYLLVQRGKKNYYLVIAE